MYRKSSQFGKTDIPDLAPAVRIFLDGLIHKVDQEFSALERDSSQSVKQTSTQKSNPETIIFHAPATPTIWSAMPSALTEFNGTTAARIKTYLTNFKEARIVVRVATIGVSDTAKISLQYSTDESTWKYLDTDSTSGSSTLEIGLGTTGVKTSSWATITTSALSDIFLRIIGKSGDGTANPAFGIIALQLR